MSILNSNLLKFFTKKTIDICYTYGNIFITRNPQRSDESLEVLDEYRVEFVTPPLEYKDIELLQNIIRELRKNGAKTDNSCGIHIHVDGANHNPQSLRRLINFIVARQDLIYEALEIEERANHWCHKLNNALLTEMKKDKNLSKEKAEEIWYSSANDGYSGGINHEHYNHTRYHGVNLHSYFSKSLFSICTKIYKSDII